VEHKQSDALERVMDMVRYLRTHCPWDAAQTPRSLIPYLLEEVHETAEAIRDEDDDALRAELGDLLLHVAFQLVLGEERDAFDTDRVADTVIDKMERRHPHLFGLGEKEDWETLKARERAEAASLLDGVARGLDPLSKAHRIQDRVATVGFDWDDATGAFEKVAEELEEVAALLRSHRPAAPDVGELRPTTAPDVGDTDPTIEQGAGDSRAAYPPSPMSGGRDGGAPPSGDGEPGGGDAGEAALEEELGDLLFAVVNLCRLAGVHALTALHGANAKFARRFQELERLAAEREMDLETASLAELEALWTRIKAAERTGEKP
jgi:MazG family protein